MKKRNSVSGVTKLMVGILVAGAVVSVPVTNVYAYTPSCSTTNQLGVKCDTIELKTMEEAKALVAELKKDGIKANLTLNSYSVEIENFLKANLNNVPVATLYECIKFVQKGGNNTTSNENNANNQNENNATTYPSNPNNQNGSNTIPCPSNPNNQNGNNTVSINDANKQNESNKTNCSNKKDEQSGKNTATVEPTNKANSSTVTVDSTDKSPGTGDSTSILMMGGVMMLSMLGMILVYFGKRKHV